jgi:hypothetical protein
LYNPTRNRDLDALPLFAHLDPERVAAAVHDRRVKRRPALPYRLPDSRVGDPGWRVTDEWRHWIVVERVAETPALLRLLGDEYLGILDRAALSAPELRWARRCENLLRAANYGAEPQDHELATPGR